ncbi:hypothetical protein OVA26_01050 [Microbacterium sp. SL62]|uniref:hypothetical protein n=1 Tax=Microbacterium sp. SL62 TaxID=2995139 RepID=UPI00227473CB|nr:hypothetical protein [Microbacterium sp. SL62]MCY1715528.1 hypothetical protein [Microbacterium sp. SL62]
MRELDSSVGSASVVIYDAAKVSLAPAEGDITVASRSAIPLLPVPETELTVRSAAVVSVLAHVDSEVRASLPARFLQAFDAWSTAGEEIPPPPHTPRAPGPAVTHEEIERHIVDFWKSDISQVHSSGRTRSRTLARIYGKIDISISTESAHGELIGGIFIADGYAVSVFGKWLSADHSDTIGLLQVCTLIDQWARLRLDLPPRHASQENHGPAVEGVVGP